MENVNGIPTYSCEGGRTFPEAQTIHIALSNCDKPSIVFINLTAKINLHILWFITSWSFLVMIMTAPLRLREILEVAWLSHQEI